MAKEWLRWRYRPAITEGISLKVAESAEHSINSQTAERFALISESVETALFVTRGTIPPEAGRGSISNVPGILAEPQAAAAVTSP